MMIIVTDERKARLIAPFWSGWLAALALTRGEDSRHGD
jgi:hypothetical protein